MAAPLASLLQAPDHQHAAAPWWAFKLLHAVRLAVLPAGQRLTDGQRMYEGMVGMDV